MTHPGSPHSTGTDLLVLHALRCVGFGAWPVWPRRPGFPSPTPSRS